MASELNPQELMMEYEYLRQEISSIDGQIRQLQEHHEALLITREGIISIKGSKDREILIPGGAGVHFNATLTNDTSCLVNVGSNIIIEMGVKKAQDTINERVEQALSMIVQLNQEAEARVQRLRQIEMVIQSMQGMTQ